MSEPVPESLDIHCQRRLENLQQEGLRRTLRTVDPHASMKATLHGAAVVNFSSNDYLGLGTSEALGQAFKEAVDRHGVCSGASRLITGTHSPHVALDEALAEFKGTEAALSFSSGYAAAVGTIPALLGAGDTVILDKLSHASLIDAAKLSGADIRVFPHNHLGKLERILTRVRARDAQARVLVVTESVFSMDGDCASLAEIVELKDRFGAWLLLDEAHAVGLLGPQGRGLAAALGLEQRVELQMGTLSKALGLSGGYIAASRAVVDLLINRARSLIYSTAPPPALAATACYALSLASGAEGDARRQKLWENKHLLARHLPRLSALPAAILPIIIGGEEQAVAMSASLLQQGYLAAAVRHPTVARGSARLRLTLSAAHEASQIEGLVTCLLGLLPELGATPPP